MTDFIDQLLDAAEGRAPLLAPRSVSDFEPLPQGQADFVVIEKEMVAPTRRQTPIRSQDEPPAVPQGELPIHAEPQPRASTRIERSQSPADQAIDTLTSADVDGPVERIEPVDPTPTEPDNLLNRGTATERFDRSESPRAIELIPLQPPSRIQEVVSSVIRKAPPAAPNPLPTPEPLSAGEAKPGESTPPAEQVRLERRAELITLRERDVPTRTQEVIRAVLGVVRATRPDRLHGEEARKEPTPAGNLLAAPVSIAMSRADPIAAPQRPEVSTHPPVQISIGRIEVKVEPSPSAPTPRAAPERAFKETPALDDFLSRRRRR